MQKIIIEVNELKELVIPKNILETYQVSNRVELILEKDCIIIKPVRKPRQGWEEAFITMHKNGDDILLIDDIL